MRFSLPVSLALLAVALPAVAQTHFCIGGDLDHLTQAEVSACQAKMTHVREAVRRRGAPNGWHFVVVCDETGWSDLAGFTGKAAGGLRNVDYNTDRDMQWTFLRGSHIETDGDSTGTVLAAALKNLPSRRLEPGSGPAPMPNPERTVTVPALQVAEVQQAAVADDAVGQ